METVARSASRGLAYLIRSDKCDLVGISTGVRIRDLVSKTCGAEGFSTYTASFDIDSSLQYHTHQFSEAVVVLKGLAQIAVEGRRYLLKPYDCLHIPGGLAHEAANPSKDNELITLSAFASPEPLRNLVNANFPIHEKGFANPSPSSPESIVRFEDASVYELSDGAEFRDLFAGRFGSVGICGGYGRFGTGSSLPCHTHHYDESITIVEGEAVCLVQGNRYHLNGYDTAFVPQGRPHRFLNYSSSSMAMIWVYAGSEPERTLVSPAYCDGSLVWPG
jgi:mannose-6-phosphate isomerase-like protein (cupin superfamily)